MGALGCTSAAPCTLLHLTAQGPKSNIQCCFWTGTGTEWGQLQNNIIIPVVSPATTVLQSPGHAHQGPESRKRKNESTSREFIRAPRYAAGQLIKQHFHFHFHFSGACGLSMCWTGSRQPDPLHPFLHPRVDAFMLDTLLSPLHPSPTASPAASISVLIYPGSQSHACSLGPFNRRGESRFPPSALFGRWATQPFKSPLSRD